ncbi:hypothetical protein Tco_0281568 [Tanacetum coccineum]
MAIQQIESMQEELHQFKRLDLRDMLKKKEIDFEESFAPVARLEAIRLCSLRMLPHKSFTFTAQEKAFPWTQTSTNVGMMNSPTSWYVEDFSKVSIDPTPDIGFETNWLFPDRSAGCLDFTKSTSGGIPILGGDKLDQLWSSKKQDCTSLSSAEAELGIQSYDQPEPEELPKTLHSYEIACPRAQVDQGSQIKMIQVKEMMQDNDLKNSKSKDKGSKSRSQSMNEQSHYKQDKTITRQSINVKRHIFNVIGGSKEFEERDLNIRGDC